METINKERIQQDHRVSKKIKTNLRTQVQTAYEVTMFIYVGELILFRLIPLVKRMALNSGILLIIVFEAIQKLFWS